MEERSTAEIGGDGGGEIGGDDEGSVDHAGGEVFAELNAREEMALPKKWEHHDIDWGRHFVVVCSDFGNESERGVGF